MRLYIDLDLLQLISAPGVRQPVESIRVKRGTAPKLELQFVREGIPELLAEGTVIRFGPKETGKYDGDFVVFTNDFTAPADTDGYYTAKPSFNTTQLNALLGSPDGNPANDVASKTLMSEFSWRLGTDEPEKTQTFNVIVDNAVDNGSEAEPISAGPDLDARVTTLETSTATKLDSQSGVVNGSKLGITGLTGGGATNLDGVATTALTSAMFALSTGDGQGIWELVAGTNAEEVPYYIRPDDYNALTNAKVWRVKVPVAGAIMNILGANPEQVLNLLGAAGGVWPLSLGGTEQTSFPAFSVHKNNTTQSGLATHGSTKITWSTEVYDDGAWFDVANGKAVAPRDGKVAFNVAVMPLNHGSGVQLRLVLWKNGAEFRRLDNVYTAANGNTQLSGGYKGKVLAGDEFEIYVYHENGSDLDIFGYSGATYWDATYTL